MPVSSFIFDFCDPVDCSPPGSSVHEDSPGKNTGVGCHFFLQGIFLTWGLNLRLLHWQADSLPLSPWKLHFKGVHLDDPGSHGEHPLSPSPQPARTHLFPRGHRRCSRHPPSWKLIRSSSEAEKCVCAICTTPGMSNTMTRDPGYRDTHALARAPEPPAGGHGL